MRIILFFFTSILLIGCDTSIRHSDYTDTTYKDGVMMTVNISIVNETAKFKCVESDTDNCFLKVSSKRCHQKEKTNICTIAELENFKLLVGEMKEFVGRDSNEQFAHCASANEFNVDDECRPNYNAYNTL
ncbi:hypothetical protein ACMAZF_13525 [Psychrobium sp. nBUS_13]|uniref:hypothetical protein n=1 Tax=Psychrobium sp. nBUS_13 TaxID=3395319 RepID=UPI003EB82A92